MTSRITPFSPAKNRFFRAFGAAAILLSFAVGSGACSGESIAEFGLEQVLEAQGDDIDFEFSDEGGFEVTSDEGTWDFSFELPEDWPDWLGHPEKFDEEQSTFTVGSGAEGIYITGRFEHDADDGYADDLADLLDKAGFELASTTSTVEDGESYESRSWRAEDLELDGTRYEVISVQIIQDATGTTLLAMGE